MKRFIGFFIAALFFAVPLVVAQDHAEVGVFADYLRFDEISPTRNFFGLGGRAAFTVHHNVQLEAEMAYDFKRDFTNTFSNGVSTELVTSQLRTLQGYFGPKFQTSSGPFRFFATGKLGFNNFALSNETATSGFQSQVGLGNSTYFALYPGVGVEGFAGPFGIRVEIGDDIYFNNGAHNNLRATFGPQLRF